MGCARSGRYTRFLCTAGALALICPVSAAERIEQTFVKENFRVITKSAVQIGDAPDHELRQEVTLGDVTYSDTRFGTTQELVYLTTDEVAGKGRHRGYFVGTHRDGSQCYGEFEGSTKLVTRPDGSWEATWEGAHRYLSGTGKCKGIEGGGTYKGSVSPTRPAREEGRETIRFVGN